MTRNIISEMLSHYELHSDYDKKNAVKEVLSEIKDGKKVYKATTP